MTTDIQSQVTAIQKTVDKEIVHIHKLVQEIKKVIVGQDDVINKVIIGLLSDGHVLIEGVPGLAKTLLVKSLAQALHCDFKRIQFTPDLLPADLIGTKIYDIQSNKFSIKKGPVFSSIILADEINRAPAKVQSALLEAMQEKQVTIGDKTYELGSPFFVLATENPIEQEGTYPLPEAQVDRFIFKINIDYPSFDEELEIVRSMSKKEVPKIHPVLKADDILKLQELCEKIYIDEKIIEYILHIVHATRSPNNYNLDIKNLIHFGASPRASIFLNKASKAFAFLDGRSYVIPEDVKAVAHDVLRHRILLTYEAEADEISSDSIIDMILGAVTVP